MRIVKSSSCAKTHLGGCSISLCKDAPEPSKLSTFIKFWRPSDSRNRTLWSPMTLRLLACICVWHTLKSKTANNWMSLSSHSVHSTEITRTSCGFTVERSLSTMDIIVVESHGFNCLVILRSKSVKICAAQWCPSSIRRQKKIRQLYPAKHDWTIFSLPVLAVIPRPIAHEHIVSIPNVDRGIAIIP